ncbi:MAG TPA: isoprenylcysteine carboxylmethyltransferase family protein [Dongiaceae bacterium]|nr:isoprenylcysteine carboxylmethyltransferase family protein [Dongiaceae bacterium]
MSAAALFARWRVRLGYVLAIAVLWFARPTPRSVFIGGLVGLFGLWLRAYAAGYLHKQSVLTVTGPYAHTRNPLYLGSAVLALGAGVATRSWISGAVLLLYFAVVYSVVMRREESELRSQHPGAFEQYAAAVPLFFPRFSAARLTGASPGAFSFAQYKKNHEYQAALGYLLLLGALLLLWRFRPW